MAWMTAGIQTDADAGAILADTGGLSTPVTVTIILWADTPLVLDIVFRNALNSGDANTQRWVTFGGCTLHTVTFPITPVLSQRMLLRVVTPYIGNAQASILF